MPLSFKPMLASAVEDLNSLRFPLLVSPKLDGIRCCIVNGEAVTRNLKSIPNAHIREALRGLPPFDGELVVGAPTASDVWNKTSSGVMSQDGTPNFAYYVFDLTSATGVAFHDRLNWVVDRARDLRKSHPFLVALPHNYVHNLHELMQYEEAFTREGYEGAMLRLPTGRYKFGRATWNERLLMKLKRFEDYEAIVTGVTERMHNGNVAMTNALGRTERSSHKANLVGTASLGALVCNAILREDRKGYKVPRNVVYTESVQFEIGTGFSEDDRVGLWQEYTMYEKLPGRGIIGKIAKFKCQGLTPDGKPRFPVFLGFRDKRDMS